MQDLETGKIILDYPGGPDAITGLSLTRTQEKVRVKVDATWQKDVV